MCACLSDSFSDRNDGLGKKKTFQHRCKYSIEKDALRRIENVARFFVFYKTF